MSAALKKPLPELLAPAGNPAAAWAALEYGADAVYAGLPRFSARAEAGNFEAETLNEMIGYAHNLGRRVYITFNTLVQQRELGEALEALALICDLNADGVIVQDLGVARMVRQNFLQLRLHASTQLAAHNLAGAQQLASLGFKRVVLARELGIDAIRRICANGGVEIETFIHGALCYSYSGLCLFSSHLLGRSGNRGRCAYCCRQPFESGGKENLPFSMKDFTAAKHLSELLAAGVASLKIEGRMKSPAYVAAVSDFYRRMLDGKLDAKKRKTLLSDIQTIFGRPSTELYLTRPDTNPIESVNAGHHGALIGTVGKIMPGGWLIFRSSRSLWKHDGLKIETPGDTFAYGFAANDLRLASDPESKRRFELPADADVAVKLPPNAPRIAKGMSIYCSISQEVRHRYKFSAPRPGQFRQRHPVDVTVFQTLEKIRFIAAANGVQSELLLDGPFEAAKNLEKAEAAVRKCFDKLGDTDWQLKQLTLNGDPVFVPMSILNDARRRLMEQLSKHWKKTRKSFGRLEACSTYRRLPACSESVFWSVKARGFLALENIDEFVLEIDPARPEEIEKALAFYGDRLRLALPVIIREEDAGTYESFLSKHWKWEAANIGALKLLREQKDVSADWSLYTLNEQAALEWKEQGVQQFVLSPEDDSRNLIALIEQLGSAAVVPIYQHTPLMISAARPDAADSELTDSSHRRFKVEQNRREFVMFNDVPFSLTNHLSELKEQGARYFRIDLSYGIDLKDAAGLVERIISGDSVPGHSGNFSRGLQ